MAVKTKAQILSEISSLLADNTTGDISAQDVRTVVNDITDSYEDLITAGTTSQYWRGDKTWQTFPDFILEAKGTLTAAQINTLDTTPVQVIPAPGANKYIFVENATFHYKFGSVAFTSAAGIYLIYNVTAETIYQNIVSTTTLNGGTSKINNAYNAQTLTLPTGIINSGVDVYIPGAISGGDGTINFNIRYRIITTS